MKVYDGAGRQSLPIDCSGLVAGAHFIRTDADGSALTVPFTLVK